jgi:hypothetical protein
MSVKKVTPLLFVEEIEPCIGFWEKVGFERGPEVPHGDKIGFVIMQKGSVEIMYQTRESVAQDVPPLADSPMKGSFLFIEVDNLDEVEQALAGVPAVVPRRKTFYGSVELVVREPAGNVITFAQFPKEENWDSHGDVD